MGMSEGEVKQLQDQMDDIADVVCRGLAVAFPDGLNYRVIAGTLAVTALGFLRRDGCTDIEAKMQLMSFIQSAPLHDLRVVDIKNHD
jgi:hypothetical protein